MVELLEPGFGILHLGFGLELGLALRLHLQNLVLGAVCSQRAAYAAAAAAEVDDAGDAGQVQEAQKVQDAKASPCLQRR